MNYPISDPAWDYAEIWAILQDSKADYEQLLKYMSEIEAGDDTTDAEIKDRLAAIGQRLNYVSGLLDE